MIKLFDKIKNLFTSEKPDNTVVNVFTPNPAPDGIVKTEEEFRNLVLYAMGWFTSESEEHFEAILDYNINYYNSTMKWALKCGIDEEEMETFISNLDFPETLNN